MLVLVTNRALAGANFLKKVEEALAGGVTQIILREKDMELEDLALLAEQIKKISEPWGAKLFINSTPEIATSVAKRVGADGIHLTFQHYMDSGLLVEEELCVGVSVHSAEEIRQIKELFKDREDSKDPKGHENLRKLLSYILAGNIFETQCKVGLAGKGLSFLKTLSEAANPIPVVAIGGISEKNIGEVMAHGAAGVAVMGAFMTESCPRELAKKLRYKQII